MCEGEMVGYVCVKGDGGVCVKGRWWGVCVKGRWWGKCV